MTEARWATEQQVDLPDDLRIWAAEDRLVRLVFAALEPVADNPPGTLTETPLPVGSLRIALTMLTYSYAIGIYGSEDIERQTLSDPQLLYLSARTYPSGSSLRHFRRHYRPLLEKSLARLFQLAWESRLDAECHASPNQTKSSTRWQAPFECAAARRIDRAIWTDSMALDT